MGQQRVKSAKIARSSSLQHQNRQVEGRDAATTQAKPIIIMHEEQNVGSSWRGRSKQQLRRSLSTSSASTPEVRCACQYYRSYSLLPERSALVAASRPPTRQTGLKMMQTAQPAGGTCNAPISTRMG